MVRSPELRRPPVRCLTASSGLCGRLVVMSSFTRDVLKRSVGVIGLYVLIGILFARYFCLQGVDVVGHLLTRLEAHVRLLPVRAKSGELAAAAFLTQEVGRAHAQHLYLEQRLYRLPDFGLGCIRSHIEYQRALGFLGAQALFSNDGALDHVIESRHQATSLRRDTVF